MDASPGDPLITPQSAERIAGVVRVAPTADLADVVEHHWIVAWDRRGRPSVTQEVLPDPCVNLAVEPGGVFVYGVTSGRSTHALAGAGTVVGTKFRPGGFSGFVREPVSAFNDRVFASVDVFGADGARLERALTGVATTSALIDVVTTFLRDRRPPAASHRNLVVEIVEEMRAALPGTRVAEIAARYGVSSRTLQRLFSAHVGASPKRVLQRFRHQDATDRLQAQDGELVSLARLAAELGYFDQAHFVQDFRAATGRLPSTMASS